MTAGRPAAFAGSLLLLVALAACWSGALDRLAGERTQVAFERALVTFAVARTLNGIISIAQGTEIALQPAGVGVVISAGEILDPLNDLIEQFSWLVLLAASSLGMQLLIGELFATTAANVAVTAVVLSAVALVVLRPAADPLRAAALRIAIGILFLRFAIVVAALASTWVAEHYLAEREAASLDYLRSTGEELRTDADRTTPEVRLEASPLERFEQFLGDSRQALGDALDVRARLDRLADRAEAAIGHVVNLIVLYAVETLLLPLGTLLLAWTGLRRLLA
jgi:hypothetical protein